MSIIKPASSTRQVAEPGGEPCAGVQRQACDDNSGREDREARAQD
jgi:hypothetical protein